MGKAGRTYEIDLSARHPSGWEHRRLTIEARTVASAARRAIVQILKPPCEAEEIKLEARVLPREEDTAWWQKA